MTRKAARNNLSNNCGLLIMAPSAPLHAFTAQWAHFARGPIRTYNREQWCQIVKAIGSWVTNCYGDSICFVWPTILPNQILTQKPQTRKPKCYSGTMWPKSFISERPFFIKRIILLRPQAVVWFLYKSLFCSFSPLLYNVPQSKRHTTCLCAVKKAWGKLKIGAVAQSVFCL